MRVLGIDPGSSITGYGIVEHEGNAISHIDNGCIRLNGTLPLSQKLHNIYVELGLLIEKYRPTVVVVENIFVAKNVHSSLMLGHARGAAMLAASTAGLNVAEYNPTQVKLSVVGQGRATKEQVQQMVRVMLKLPEIAMEDASDALAVAICHCNSSRMKGLIEKQT